MDTQRQDWTVVGVWVGDSPIPVGVIRGRHDVEGGDSSEFPEGLWATSVTAGDSTEAESLAVAEMSSDDEDDEVPADWPVRPIGPDDEARDRVTCGTCHRSWDDAIATAYTPAPAARCPFEAWH